MNLETYFERIGYSGRPEPDLETLRTLHLAHATSIPFENLSTLLGEPIPLDIEALEDKLLARRRGGYCFEQNALFGHVLERIGYDVTPLAARVVWGTTHPEANPRSHMALLIRIAGDAFICDVGFGGATLTAPLRLLDRHAQKTPHERFRIRREGRLFVLGIEVQQQWKDAYEFDLQAQRPIDYEAMNHFVQTHPTSHFPHTLIACRPDASGRYTLRDNDFRRYENGRLVSRESLATAAALEEVLQDAFRIVLPENERLGAILRAAAAKGTA